MTEEQEKALQKSLQQLRWSFNRLNIPGLPPEIQNHLEQAYDGLKVHMENQGIELK